MCLMRAMLPSTVLLVMAQFAAAPFRRSVRAFPAGVRNVDDDAVGAGPFHLEIGVAAGRHCRIDMVLRGQPLAVRAFERLASLVEIVDLEAEMMDAGEVRAVRAH